MGTEKYTIVVPVYYNEGCLRPTFESFRREIFDANPGWTPEVIFVDDGSGDGSLKEALEIRAENPQTVKVIKLTRNYGQVFALIAGFSHAKGECVIAISADQQDPASVVSDMLRAYFNEKYEIVIAARKGRDESFYRVATSRFFYWLMRKFCFSNMPVGGFDLVLLGPRAKQAFLREKDPHPFFQGKILSTGYRTKFLSYRRKERKTGKSRWTFAKKLTFLIDGLLSYSYAPIRFMSIAGGIIALLGFSYAGIVLVNRTFYGNPVKGWAPLMIVILVLSGFQMLMIGVIGEYLWRTLAQVRDRDQYLIDEVYE
ncbi:MAG: glycosyltransferase family 2 protein [Elusimicrobiales bacterium]